MSGVTSKLWPAHWLKQGKAGDARIIMIIITICPEITLYEEVQRGGIDSRTLFRPDPILPAFRRRTTVGPYVLQCSHRALMLVRLGCWVPVLEAHHRRIEV